MDNPLTANQRPLSSMCHADCLAGGGKLGAAMRALDWSTTQVGAVEKWPNNLCASVMICLNSRSPTAIWWGRQYRTMFFNDAYQAILGETACARWLGRSGYEDEAYNGDIVRRKIEHIFETGEPSRVEDELVGDQSCFHGMAYFSYSFYPIRGETGEVDGVFCCCVETTGRVIAEQRIRALARSCASINGSGTVDESAVMSGNAFVSQSCDLPETGPREWLEFTRRQGELDSQVSEQRFVGFMEHLPGLVWIKDLQGRYVYANDAAEKAFRARREELYGKTDPELFPTDVAAQFQENDRRALASETGIQAIETLEHDDGRLHYSLVNKFAIPGRDDQAALVGGMAVDITALMQAKDSIHESEVLFRHLAEAMPQLVYVATADGTIQYLNQRWRDFTGVPNADPASLRAVIHPDDFSLMYERWGDAAAKKSPFEAEIRIRRASDGSYRWFLARALPIGGSHGIVTQWFGTSTDIDDQKRAEQVQHTLAEAGRLFASSFDCPVGLGQRLQASCASAGRLVLG